jgi:hypothetical protein
MIEWAARERGLADLFNLPAIPLCFIATGKILIA